ncbi:MAG: hypothetical protein ABIG34_05630 [Candidatus Peregrinibacteria bacterium]
MSYKPLENTPLSAAPEGQETQPAAPQESAAPPSLDEGRIRTENRDNREGLSQSVNDPEAKLQQGIAVMQQPEGAKPGTPEEDDLGTNKGAFERVGDAMQKMFAMVQKFMKQIQSMGSATLRGMASTLTMLGFKKAAEWLNEMAGADYAELVSALKKGNLTLSVINPEDANAKAQTEIAEGAQTMLAEQYKVLAQTRGPTFTREVYYNEVVREWKKTNGTKTQIVAEDFRAMAAAAKELPGTLPGQVAQAPEFVSPLESVTTAINVMGPAPTKVQVLNQTVALQVLPNGEWNVSVGPATAPLRYRLVPTAITDPNSLRWEMRNAQLSQAGFQFEGKATGSNTAPIEYFSPKVVAMTDVRAFLEAVVRNPNGAQYTSSEFRFERIPV